jgi:hypothetical protein
MPQPKFGNGQDRSLSQPALNSIPISLSSGLWPPPLLSNRGVTPTVMAFTNMPNVLAQWRQVEYNLALAVLDRPLQRRVRHNG